MLGDQIGEVHGQITNQRVNPGEHGLMPTVETNFNQRGTLLGVEVTGLGTYTGQMRPDGSLVATGQGVLRSPDGSSRASWQGQGVGQFAPDGRSINWRGSVIYTSDSPAFAELRTTLGVFEFTSTAEGGAEGKLWAWK
jgi:hypothetical protein